MYTQVLSSALANPKRSKAETEWLIARLKKVVGSIVTLFDVLSVTALGDLLSLGGRAIEDILDSLGSVLNIPSDTKEPIQLLHPSFRDFLLDKARCEDNRFHVRKETVHTYLAIRCQDVLRENLRKDICNLESPDFSPQEISKHILDHFLPKYVQYACQYWIEHLACACSVDTSPQQRSQLGLCDNGKIHDFFKGHFLYWLEAMSIMGKMHEMVLMMKKLLAMLKVSCDFIPSHKWLTLTLYFCSSDQPASYPICYCERCGEISSQQQRHYTESTSTDICFRTCILPS